MNSMLLLYFFNSLLAHSALLSRIKICCHMIFSLKIRNLNWAFVVIESLTLFKEVCGIHDL